MWLKLEKLISRIAGFDLLNKSRIIELHADKLPLILDHPLWKSSYMKDLNFLCIFLLELIGFYISIVLVRGGYTHYFMSKFRNFRDRLSVDWESTEIFSLNFNFARLSLHFYRQKPVVFKDSWRGFIYERSLPNELHAKLMPMVDGPLKFLQCIGENAYKFKLPRDYDVSATFNVSIIHRPMKKKASKTWGTIFFN